MIRQQTIETNGIQILFEFEQVEAIQKYIFVHTEIFFEFMDGILTASSILSWSMLDLIASAIRKTFSVTNMSLRTDS